MVKVTSWLAKLGREQSIFIRSALLIKACDPLVLLVASSSGCALAFVTIKVKATEELEEVGAKLTAGAMRPDKASIDVRGVTKVDATPGVSDAATEVRRNSFCTLFKLACPTTI